MKNLDIDALLLEANAVYDNPSKYDYQWAEYAEGGGSGVSKITDSVKIKVWDQYDQQETYKACSCYGLTVIFNGYNVLEYKKGGIDFEQEDPRRKWQVFQAERGYPDMGASLQDMMSFFKKRGLIDGYVQCKTVQECKNAINNGFLIYTGTNQCNWANTNKNKEFYHIASGGAHCFSIIDYDNTGFIAINSFGEDWGDKGLFHINFDSFDYLYSKYAIIDHDDTGKLSELKYKMEYQKAIELEITNGTRPTDPVTRQECAVMCERVYDMLLKKIQK